MPARKNIFLYTPPPKKKRFLLFYWAPYTYIYVHIFCRTCSEGSGVVSSHLGSACPAKRTEKTVLQSGEKTKENSHLNNLQYKIVFEIFFSLKDLKLIWLHLYIS